jgi:hypothetical protein
VIRAPELSATVLEKIGRLLRAAELHPAAVVDVDLDTGRLAFFRRSTWPVCAPQARRAAADALRAHVQAHGLEGLHDLAEVCGPALARSCADQIDAGDLGPNAPDTDRAKARRGQPPTRGVATGALVQALRTARPYEP